MTTADVFEIQINQTRVILKQGNLLEEKAEAIVNAANQTLFGGGGIDGQIHSKAGPELLEECKKIPEIRSGVRCPTGEAKLTKSARLEESGIRFVIHAVGPRWRPNFPKAADLLYSAYFSSLKLAASHKIKTIAFPAISTGVYHYPLREATQTALRAISDFCTKTGLDSITLIFYGESEFKEALKAAKEVLLS